MKLKVIKQQLAQLQEQQSQGEVLDRDILTELKSALQEKKMSCQHKLRHRANFKKREKMEKKLKKIKSHLKVLKALSDAAPS